MLDTALAWNGEGDPPPVPWLWLVSNVCDAFGVLPRAAVRELKSDPERMALKIMHLRSYAAAWQDVKSRNVDATHPLVGRVLEVKIEKRRRARARHEAQGS